MKIAEYGFHEVYRQNFITRNWEIIRKIRKPVIVAVNGYVLVGGCELAMMCDMVIDGDRFGQPEVRSGILPGAGGMQRLPGAISKSKATDLCLTGRMMDTAKPDRVGLVSRIFSLQN